MAFLETPRFPVEISFGAVGGPVWSTTIVKTMGGARSTNRNWEFPLHRYNISQAIRTNEDFEAVRSFFFNVYGMADSFRFKDYADFRANQLNSRLTLITGATYQLERIYVTGARTLARPIYKPLSGGIVYRTRASVVTTATASIDTTTGIATISGHVGGDTYTWSGEFDVPVSFSTDQMEAQIQNRHPNGEYLINWPSIELEEVRL
jgi:uncharacterized protein (TIGR02217 family)